MGFTDQLELSVLRSGSAEILVQPIGPYRLALECTFQLGDPGRILLFDILADFTGRFGQMTLVVLCA